MEVVWYTAMSMDGRIATPQHDLGFLETIAMGDEDDHDFQQFTDSIDAVIIGASTMRWLLDGGHAWPHDDLPTWLVSHDTSLAARIGETRAPLRRVEGDPAQAVREIAELGLERVWLCGGGSIAGQLLAADALDEVIVTIAPTALGAGPALFDAPEIPRRTFTLEECRKTGNAVRVRWRVARD